MLCCLASTFNAFVSVCVVSTTPHRARAAFFRHLMVCTATKKVFEDVKQIAQAQVESESAHAVMEEAKDKASQLSSKLLREGKDVDVETLAKEARDILEAQKCKCSACITSIYFL